MMGGLQSMGLRNPLALHLPIGPSQPPQLSQTQQVAGYQAAPSSIPLVPY
jgi:hypothetical protein